MDRPLVYVIILTYNSKKWMKESINSVLASDYKNFKLLIVDNFSSDGGADYIKQTFPDVEIIRTEQNYGYGEGNNVGIRHALARGAEYTVILNPDTKVPPFWLDKIIDVARDYDCGITVPMFYDYDGKSVIENFQNCLKDSRKVDERFTEVKHMIGAAFCVRSDVFRAVGAFDPFYFIYYDESDFMRRVRAQHFKIGIATESKIYHYSSVVHKSQMKPKIRYYYTRNELVYFYKDPKQNIFKSIADYWFYKFTQAKEKQGLWRGLLSCLKLFCIQFHTIIYIPLIILKKKRELSNSCYL